MIERVEAIWSDLEKIRLSIPLVGYMSGFGVMNNLSNMLLAVGAAPKAILCEEEAEDTVPVCSAMFLTSEMARGAYLDQFQKIMPKAKESGVPFVFDPAGVSGSVFRSDICMKLLSDGRPTVIKGNAAEIMALRALFIPQDDSSPAEDELSEYAFLRAAHQLSHFFECVVVVSGLKSHVVYQDEESQVMNGSMLMLRNADTPAFASALCATFAAVNPNPYEACINAMFVLGIAAEIGEQDSDGPGTYLPRFLDALANMAKYQLLLK